MRHGSVRVLINERMKSFQVHLLRRTRAKEMAVIFVEDERGFVILRVGPTQTSNQQNGEHDWKSFFHTAIILVLAFRARAWRRSGAILMLRFGALQFFGASGALHLFGEFQGGLIVDGAALGLPAG